MPVGKEELMFARLLVQAFAVFIILIAFSLAGAITPRLAGLGTLVDVPADLVFYIISALLLTVLGYFLGTGIKNVKGNFESLGLAYVSSFIAGVALAVLNLLHFPYVVHLRLNWFGTAWYDPWLLFFFLGTPIILTFVAI
jgi:hypothetical protein